MNGRGLLNAWRNKNIYKIVVGTQKEHEEVYAMDWYDSGREPVAGSCKRRNEHSGSTKRKFLDLLINYKLLKNDSPS
jgi:hypothetical protein